MGKDGAGGGYGSFDSLSETRRIEVKDEKLIKVSKSLLDESERMFYMELDENRFLPHLFRAINNMRKELGMKRLQLDVKEV